VPSVMSNRLSAAEPFPSIGFQIITEAAPMDDSPCCSTRRSPIGALLKPLPVEPLFRYPGRLVWSFASTPLVRNRCHYDDLEVLINVISGFSVA
jgi:hypothetical protein